MVIPFTLWSFRRPVQKAHSISFQLVGVLATYLFKARLCCRSPVRSSDITEVVMRCSDNLALIIGASDWHLPHRHHTIVAWLGAVQNLCSYFDDLKISIVTVTTGCCWFLTELERTRPKNQKVPTAHRPFILYRFQTLWTGTKSALQKLILYLDFQCF